MQQVTIKQKPPKTPTDILNAITPVTEDCPVEVFRWGGPQDHHVADSPHEHVFDEILIFKKGGGKHWINDAWYEVQDFSLHFIPVGVEHLLFRPDTADGGTVIFLRKYLAHEPQLPFKQLFFMESKPVLNLSTARFGGLWLIYEQLLLEAGNSRHFYRKEAILSWLNAFLVKIASYYRTAYPDIEEHNMPTNRLAQTFQELVEQHFQDQKSVEFYARKLYISSKYLHEISRKHLGKCPQDIIAGQTISTALALLQSSTTPIKNIAANLGFSDPAYFSRFFKKHTGKSPLEWQLMQRG